MRVPAPVLSTRNFLKLGVNSYLRLSGWKDSPTRGLSGAASKRLGMSGAGLGTAAAAVGRQATYEQYYGKEVALVRGGQSPEPHAITVGINYKFPGAADHRGGTASGQRFRKSDTLGRR